MKIRVIMELFRHEILIPDTIESLIEFEEILVYRRLKLSNWIDWKSNTSQMKSTSRMSTISKQGQWQDETNSGEISESEEIDGIKQIDNSRIKIKRENYKVKK